MSYRDATGGTGYAQDTWSRPRTLDAAVRTLTNVTNLISSHANGRLRYVVWLKAYFSNNPVHDSYPWQLGMCRIFLLSAAEAISRYMVGARTRQPYTARLLLRPIIHCYTVQGMLQCDWRWVMKHCLQLVGTTFSWWYRLGLVAVDMHCGFTRLIGITTVFKSTDTPYLRILNGTLSRKGCARGLRNSLAVKDTSGGMAYLTQMSLFTKPKHWFLITSLL